MKAAAVALRGLLGALVLAHASLASATPSRWSLARSDGAYREEVAVRAAEESLIESTSQRRRERDPLADPTSPVRAALIALEAGRITRDSSPYPRQLLARALQSLSRWSEAVPVWESILRDRGTPDVFRSDALSEVAIAYARVGRQHEETEAYEGALALEEGGGSPHMLPLDWPSGGRVTMLANQAEAFMVQGDVERAIAGYRASLEAVDSTVMGLAYSPTALWSLGVALDRIAAYERCVTAWTTYLSAAPESDKYVPIARARFRLASKEFEALRKRAATPTPIDPKQPAQP